MSGFSYPRKCLICLKFTTNLAMSRAPIMQQSKAAPPPHKKAFTAFNISWAPRKMVRAPLILTVSFLA